MESIIIELPIPSSVLDYIKSKHNQDEGDLNLEEKLIDYIKMGLEYERQEKNQKENKK